MIKFIRAISMAGGVRVIVLVFIFILFGAAAPVPVYAQPEIQLPAELTLMVDGTPFIPSDSWVDSLIGNATGMGIKYRIVSTVQSDVSVTTKVRIPQVLPFSAVLRQIVLYYALLGDERSRAREKLLIYPYFAPLTAAPAISCSYSGSSGYEISRAGWTTVPLPPAPNPEERFIHNQIIEKSLENLDIIDDIPEEIFEEVARENHRTVPEIIAIYRKIQLWQMGSR